MELQKEGRNGGIPQNDRISPRKNMVWDRGSIHRGSIRTAGWKSSFVFFMIDIMSELPFLIVLRTINVHSKLRRNPFREGGLTGLQRKPSEVVLIRIQSIIYVRINIPK